MTRAIAYIPSADYERSAARCIEYIHAMGYDFKGLVRDWATVQRMFEDDEITCAIVAHPAELDPARKPRVEFVSDSPPHGNEVRRWDERTRLIRRNVVE